MAWHYGTFSCGHEGRVDITGPVKNREWKAERKFAGLCEECWLEQREEERRKELERAERKSKEMELPELVGSEKQVAWAKTLRQDLAERFDKFRERMNEPREWKECKRLYEREFHKVEIEDIDTIKGHILENVTSAKIYIDERDQRVIYWINKNKDEALKSEEDKREEQYQKELLERERVENTVYPEDRITESIVEIEVDENKIKASFEKDRTFIEIVKELGYSWEGVWERELSATTGSYVDRAAELGNRLLSEGFPVTFPSSEIKEKAIEGDFEQEHTRWIRVRESGRFDGMLAIRWLGYDKELYEVARKLPGSRWNNGSVLVGKEKHRELEDFANIYDFKFSDNASKVIDKHKKTMDEAEKVRVKEVKIKELKGGLKEILNSSDEVLDDLLDEN